MIETKIAVRNLIANSRRTLLTLLIIVVGLTAVLFIAGYINMVRVGFGELLIGEKYSHFQIYKKGFLDTNEPTSMAYSLSPEETAKIEEILSAREEVNFILPRINLHGMVGTTEDSKIFLGYSADPFYESFMTYGTIEQGIKLDMDDPYQCVVGKGLAKKMGLDLGAELLIQVPNEGGGLEAELVSVGGIANFGPEELNNTAVLTSIDIGRSLNYTDNNQYLLVMLHETQYLEDVLAYLKDEVARAGLDLEFRTWVEMDPFYQKVMRDYTFQLNLIAGIFLFVILLAVSNTIYMSIVERTPEIGTLRAIGISRLEIIRTILKEGLILGIIGVSIGVGLAYLIQILLRVVYVELPPPPSLTNPIRLAIGLRVKDVFMYSGLLAGCSTFATLFPGLKAANTNIVSALRHA
ncbi:MAG: hypothetical protein B0D92_04095 [Spirochaeta sp. LUC14_002_19_P3]|nr:MAG: hypothetical protein B0D92_04095 [Spirochaeta sp. LUC14_002_19_P3]